MRIDYQKTRVITEETRFMREREKQRDFELISDHQLTKIVIENQSILFRDGTE